VSSIVKYTDRRTIPEWKRKLWLRRICQSTSALHWQVYILGRPLYSWSSWTENCLSSLRG